MLRHVSWLVLPARTSGPIKRRNFQTEKSDVSGWSILELENPKGGNSPLRGDQGPKLLEAFSMHKSVFRIQLHKVRVYSE